MPGHYQIKMDNCLFANSVCLFYSATVTRWLLTQLSW